MHKERACHWWIMDAMCCMTILSNGILCSSLVCVLRMQHPAAFCLLSKMHNSYQLWWYFCKPCLQSEMPSNFKALFALFVGVFCSFSPIAVINQEDHPGRHSKHVCFYKQVDSSIERIIIAKCFTAL